MRKKAHIALTTVLLVSSLLLTGGTILVLTTIDTALGVKSLSINIDTKNHAKTCIEESLYKIDKNKSYTGNSSVTEGNKTCTYTVSNNANPSLKTVVISSSIGSYNYSTTFTVNITTNPITPIY